MPRTIEFGEDPDDRRIIDEDGVASRAPRATESTDLAIVGSSSVTKTSARAAVNMRYAGAPYDEIARMLNYTDAAQARKVVEETLARAYPTENRETLFQLANGRLQRLLRKVDEQTDAFIPARDDRGRVVKDSAGEVVLVANPEQLAYVKVAADLAGRWIRLNGLEAPTQVQITPDAQAFDAVVRQMKDAALAGAAPEADVFADVEDAEIVVEEGELDG